MAVRNLVVVCMHVTPINFTPRAFLIHDFITTVNFWVLHVTMKLVGQQLCHY